MYKQMDFIELSSPARIERKPLMLEVLEKLSYTTPVSIGLKNLKLQRLQSAGSFKEDKRAGGTADRSQYEVQIEGSFFDPYASGTQKMAEYVQRLQGLQYFSGIRVAEERADLQSRCFNFKLVATI